MKFSIDKQELSDLCNLVYRAASSKNSIPVLSGILLDLDPATGLTLTATDMEIGIKANTTNIEVIQPGKVLVNASYFNSFIKSVPDTRLNIEYDTQTSKLKVLYGRSSGSINTYQDYEYPDLLLEGAVESFELPQRVLKEALKKTAFAAALNHFRQVFTGVFFELSAENVLKVVASDTHRLAFFQYEMNSDLIKPCNFVLPLRTAHELLRVLNDSDEPVKIALQENNVIFTWKNILLLSRLINGQYPAYNQVIPVNFINQLRIKTGVLAEILDRARTMPRDENLKLQYVQLSLNQGEASFYAYSDLMGELNERVDDISISGENELKITLNTNYFLDAVRVLQGEGEELEIKFSGPFSPALIHNPEKNNYLYVLVPLRTSR
ncbi:DNA polymerase III subunit beta [Syntrophomonas palmitatica]|uniref:DNA polymerase III subunit beta n=1 Tax=Syntrophomonas palmitatica TaxID=402877 RepID=UPI0006D06F15|nr:DNA polymerase III subunit beta [Syntrophomonas palmitatica]